MKRLVLPRSGPRRALAALLTTLMALVVATGCAPAASIPARGPSAPPPSPSGAALVGATILIGTARLAGRSVTVLANGRGHTLYYRSKDRPPRRVCTYGCAVSWPPLLIQQGVATASAPLPGTLDSVINDNGKQVTYNGHPLYSFTDDTEAGLARGQRAGRIWFVATPDLPPA